MNDPDFSVKKLSEYSVEDLETLFNAVTINIPAISNIDSYKILDIWAYRIKDAIKEAKQTKQ